MQQASPRREPGDRRPGARRLPAILVLALGALIMAAGALLVLKVSGPTGIGDKAATSPQILVDRTEIDFGQVPVNQRVKADFTLTNGGGLPLQIVGQPQVELVKGC